MIQMIKNIFGLGPQINYKELLQSGAQIIDVRTPGEFNRGHVKGSLNLPLQNLQNNLSKVKKNKPIITCCATGMRSASAKSLLTGQGFAEVYNAGSWVSLQNKIN